MSEWKSNIPEDLDLSQKYSPIKSKTEREEISQKVKEKFKDPIFKQKHQEAIDKNVESDWWKEQQKLSAEKRKNNPEWLKKLNEGIEFLRNDPERWAEYQANYQKGNMAKYDDPAYWEAYYSAIAKRDADPEYHKKRIEASKKKICKKIQTPDGVFESISEAARHYGLNPEGMRHRVKSKTFPEYYILEKED